LLYVNNKSYNSDNIFTKGAFMRILNVLTQKPNSTGSGVYMTELVKQFQALGHEQAVVAGIDVNDSTQYLPGIRFCPVKFNTIDLPFNVVGMSDVMPYPSTRYNQLTSSMTGQLEKAFMSVLEPLIADFRPDLIICHHLYFLTALIREFFPRLKVVAICHGTDLRQLHKTDLARERITHNIPCLDAIFALHEQQQKEISELFHIPLNKIKILGAGYNDSIFYDKNYKKAPEPIKIIYAGKISYKKGVASLLKALDNVPISRKFDLALAGGYSNLQEYNEIISLAQETKYQPVFLGKLTQEELAEKYNQSHIMVLPSFFEGLPLVIIEALACGLNIVTTDLPGVQDWLDSNIPNHTVLFVPPPRMLNVDEPLPEDLPLFQKNLAQTIAYAVDNYRKTTVDLTNVTWLHVAQKLLTCYFSHY
jgi:glycosyltransferase involved in cell wall biosynthesis